MVCCTFDHLWPVLITELSLSGVAGFLSEEALRTVEKRSGISWLGSKTKFLLHLLSPLNSTPLVKTWVLVSLLSFGHG